MHVCQWINIITDAFLCLADISVHNCSYFIIVMTISVQIFVLIFVHMYWSLCIVSIETFQLMCILMSICQWCMFHIIYNCNIVDMIFLIKFKK